VSEATSGETKSCSTLNGLPIEGSSFFLGDPSVSHPSLQIKFAEKVMDAKPISNSLRTHS